MRVENRRFMRKMGEIVTDRLEENFRDLMNYDFTAQMEDRSRSGGQPSGRMETGFDNFGDFTRSCKRRRKIRKRAACSRTPWS